MVPKFHCEAHSKDRVRLRNEKIKFQIGRDSIVVNSIRNLILTIFNDAISTVQVILCEAAYEIIMNSAVEKDVEEKSHGR
jgi:hypothetical protein